MSGTTAPERPLRSLSIIQSPRRAPAAVARRLADHLAEPGPADLVAALQRRVADLLGKQAALLLPTETWSVGFGPWLNNCRVSPVVAGMGTDRMEEQRAPTTLYPSHTCPQLASLERGVRQS